MFLQGNRKNVVLPVMCASPFLSKGILLSVGFGGHALQAFENAGIVIFVQKTDLFTDLGNAHPGKTQERDGPAGPH